MAALNHAIMIPGLILIVLIFFLWIPIWAAIWLIRRSRTKDPNAPLEWGESRPHKGFQPGRNSSYRPPAMLHRFRAGPLKTKTHQFHNAAEKAAYDLKHGILSAEAVQAKQAARARSRSRGRQHGSNKKKEADRGRKHSQHRESDDEKRRREKGKGRETSSSSRKSASSTRRPDAAVTREDRERRHSSASRHSRR